MHSGLEPMASSNGVRSTLKTKFLERKLEQFEDLKTEIAGFEEKLGEIQERQHG